MPGPDLLRVHAGPRRVGSLLTNGQELAHRPPPLTWNVPARAAAPVAGSGARPGADDSPAEAASTGWPPPPSEAGGTLTTGGSSMTGCLPRLVMARLPASS